MDREIVYRVFTETDQRLGYKPVQLLVYKDEQVIFDGQVICLTVEGSITD